MEPRLARAIFNGRLAVKLRWAKQAVEADGDPVADHHVQDGGQDDIAHADAVAPPLHDREHQRHQRREDDHAGDHLLEAPAGRDEWGCYPQLVDAGPAGIKQRIRGRRTWALPATVLSSRTGQER